MYNCASYGFAQLLTFLPPSEDYKCVNRSYASVRRCRSNKTPFAKIDAFVLMNIRFFKTDHFEILFE